MYLMVQPKPALGQIAYAPSSLLMTELAILIASLAEGTSVIYHDLRCHETLMLREACQAIGAIIHSYPDHLDITGVGGQIQFQRKNLHCRQSAWVFQVFTALACFSQVPVVLNAHASFQEDVLPFFDAMKQLGAAIEPIDFCANIPLIHWGGGISNDICDLPGHVSPACLIALIIMATLASTPILVRIHGRLIAQLTLMRTITMLTQVGITVETDEAYSLIRIYPGVAKASRYQLCGDYDSVVPLLLLFALHPGSYDIYQLTSDNPPAILGLFTDIGLLFHQEPLTNCLRVSHREQHLAGQFHISITDYVDVALFIVVLSAFVRGRVRIVGVMGLPAAMCSRLEQLLAVLDKLGVIFSLTRVDGCIEVIDMIGAASYQGGLVFNDLTDADIFMALVIASTRCRQANYFAYLDVLEGAFPDFMGEMQRLGVRCEWVVDALQVQPYWLTAS